MPTTPPTHPTRPLQAELQEAQASSRAAGRNTASAMACAAVMQNLPQAFQADAAAVAGMAHGAGAWGGLPAGHAMVFQLRFDQDSLDGPLCRLFS